jgi:site-specific DNA-methyltransferase (adenine-specific)
MSGFDLFRGDALDAYRNWPAPATIVSDGACGVRGFHGDTIGPEDLPRWYRPHIAAWAAAAGPASTLWFWNTELGWASVHPVLAEFGWEYVQLIVWDKGLAHIAGNVNGRTIRQFPVVTEVCAFYQRSFTVTGPDGPMPPKQWIRHEWTRSGLSLQRANEACGVKNAATRKYLTKDWLWYWPPGEMTERLAGYANAHGQPTGWPYYSLDGERPVTAAEWDALRYTWRHAHGVTNVWSRRPLHGEERLKGTGRRAAPRVHNPTAASSAHLNQKPLEFMERLIMASLGVRPVANRIFSHCCSSRYISAADSLRNRCRARSVVAVESLGGLAAEEVGQEGRRDHRVSQYVEVPVGHELAHGPEHIADQDQDHGGDGRAGRARVPILQCHGHHEAGRPERGRYPFHHGIAWLAVGDLLLDGRAGAVGPTGHRRGHLIGVLQLGSRGGHGQRPGVVSQVAGAEQGQEILVVGCVVALLGGADGPPVLDLPGDGRDAADRGHGAGERSDGAHIEARTAREHHLHRDSLGA